MKMFRQGDILIREVQSIPSKSEKQNRDGDIVLAWGETTGHRHRIDDPWVEEYKFDVDVFLKVLKETQIKHEEHAPILLPKGVYKIVRQREYSPEEIRRVAD